ncbi:MAG: hypothetical protein B7Z37_20920 [Verrucomicrobia bacterium 12-59-8]|nr:MAG: hypothetical protein B7Z37_20920 [Verrucomicrobia bacterium 12-59-8]
MRTIKVYCSSGDIVTTSINGTDAEIRAYYVGNMLNLGDGAGGDRMVRAVVVDFLDKSLDERIQDALDAMKIITVGSPRVALIEALRIMRANEAISRRHTAFQKLYFDLHLEPTPIVMNARSCGICGEPADQYHYGFQCRANRNHVGDLNVGLFDDLSKTPA